jgi:hypothetical protein
VPRTENVVLTAIVYFQPITRELSQLFANEVSRDVLAGAFPEGDDRPNPHNGE